MKKIIIKIELLNTINEFKKYLNDKYGTSK